MHFGWLVLLHCGDGATAAALCARRCGWDLANGIPRDTHNSFFRGGCDGGAARSSALHIWTLPPGDADFAMRWRLIRA